ncbi:MULTISPECIES: hypothetical protein [Pseudanabaena]|uniref:hypothetical protein n=1 Tax=Pseudanabaena TaxID=1152 RepID=UPI00247AE1A6|nr:MULTISPECIES: hypothetical protein [Pseudanabaena]MEA5487743.1 hypothetical protein [Pseudanabaena sp. CCNP1317]WGS72518.1 hypothetical protein OA858_00405 [Pseudanabaena galeata CCNP1313]
MNDFPYPIIKSFERLQVSDGLMINSERWRLAHEYHQHRQNVQYQSLFLPGIICGLGVAPIAAPEDLPAKFRDGRWVQIQPGLAIDLQGNFIVVPTPLDFRISTTAYDAEIAIVYLVLSYVDPAKLKRVNGNEVLVETFRVNEKTDLPLETDIEICRIAIAEGKLEIQKPTDIFSPQVSQLDMRYRLQAQIRPQNLVRVATFSDNQQGPIQENLHFLGQSLSSLAPSLSLIEPIGMLDLNAELTLSYLSSYHLICLTHAQVLTINDATQLALREYIAMGGVVLIEASIRNSQLENLVGIYNELQNASNKLKKTSQSQSMAQQADQSSIQSELLSELEAIAIEINSSTQDFLDSLRSRVPMETPMQAFSDLERTHPLRSQPFLFPNLSAIADQPMQILTNGGLIVILGKLSPIWSGQSDQALTRETIRNSQELGINILHYAAQRYGMYQSMQVNPQYQNNLNLQPESDQRRITNMVDTTP